MHVAQGLSPGVDEPRHPYIRIVDTQLSAVRAHQRLGDRRRGGHLPGPAIGRASRVPVDDEHCPVSPPAEGDPRNGSAVLACQPECCTLGDPPGSQI